MPAKNNNSSRNCGLFGRFVRESDGAVLIYVSLIIVVLFGFVGLAVDFGRFYTTNTQAQSAADAAALAGATQLDGAPTAITRATLAAQTSPLVSNVHTFATNVGAVQIVLIRFLHSLPPSDDDPITDAYVTTDPAAAAYIEVTTELLNQDNFFLAAVGAYSGQTDAVAVAGYKTSYCKMPPLMICNPWEGDPTMVTRKDINDKMGGVTLLAKTKEGGVDAWDSGVMGLLDPPPYYDEETKTWDTSTNTGAKQVALALAKVPQDFCYPETPISIRTGQADAMRGAINVFFDIYENPFFGAGNVRSDPDFRPAANVTKGYISEIVEVYQTDPDTGAVILDPITGEPIVIGTDCQSTYSEDQTLAMGMPPDTCFVDTTSPDYMDFKNPSACASGLGPTGSEARIGDGVWNFSNPGDPTAPGYWEVNHPGVLAPLAPMDGWPSGKTDPTRYDIYLYELANAIPDNSANTPAGEDGNPMCYTGGGSLTGAPDRRLLNVALINCEAEGVAGNSVPESEAVFMAQVFVIRPVRGGSDSNIWLEFVKVLEQGEDGVHDMIQLVR